jgi:hypothetical protein
MPIYIFESTHGGSQEIAELGRHIDEIAKSRQESLFLCEEFPDSERFRMLFASIHKMDESEMHKIIQAEGSEMVFPEEVFNEIRELAHIKLRHQNLTILPIDDYSQEGDAHFNAANAARRSLTNSYFNMLSGAKGAQEQMMVWTLKLLFNDWHYNMLRNQKMYGAIKAIQIQYPVASIVVDCGLVHSRFLQEALKTEGVKLLRDISGAGKEYNELVSQAQNAAAAYAERHGSKVIAAELAMPGFIAITRYAVATFLDHLIYGVFFEITDTQRKELQKQMEMIINSEMGYDDNLSILNQTVSAYGGMLEVGDL